MSPETYNAGRPKRHKWNDEPVVIAEGECDTMAGCDLVRARIGKRLNELHGRIQHILTKPAVPERVAFLELLRAEQEALVHTRFAVAKRKDVLAQTQVQRDSSSLYAAVAERFGSDVLRELTERAKEITEAVKRRKAAALVGSVIPVGAIGAPRLRGDEWAAAAREAATEDRTVQTETEEDA